MLKKILKICGYVVFFLIVLIISLEKFVGDSKFNINDVANSIKDINTANIKIHYSKVFNDEENGNEQINFIYNFNYDNNFSNEKYKNVIATNGTIGFEVESLELGFYAPIQTIYKDKSIEAFLSIDEVYEDVFNINSNQLLRINSDELFDILNLSKDNGANEINLIKNEIFKSIYKTLSNNKKSFTYLKNDKQNITSGKIGRLQGVLTEEILEEIHDNIKKDINKDLYNKYNLDKIIKYIIDNFKSSNIYFDIYKSQIAKINVENINNKLSIEINNINNPNNITFNDTKNIVEFKDYFEDNLEMILELFGYNAKVEYKGIYNFKNKVNEIINYMSLAISCLDEKKFDDANAYIDSIEKNIIELKTTDYSKDETMKDINTQEYFMFLDNLNEYILLYRDSCEEPDVDLSSELRNSVDKLNKSMIDLKLIKK